MRERQDGDEKAKEPHGWRPAGVWLVKNTCVCYHYDMTATADVRILTRRTLIDMARRRQRRGSGSTREFLLERTTMLQWPDLTPVLSPVLWTVVGAAATRLYMPERLTRDLDIVIGVQDIEVAYHKLSEAGYIQTGTLSIGGTRWQSPSGVSIDVIEGRAPWWPAALQEAQSNRDEQGLPVLHLPYLVLMKFNASRTIDLGDIARMLGLADEVALAQVRHVFRQYAPNDLDDLESLITLGKLEMDSPPAVM